MKISDSHTDFMTSIDSRDKREKYISTICGKVKNLCCAIFTTNKNFSVEDIINFKKEIDYLQGKYKINLLFSLEDIGFIKNEEELYRIVSLRPFSVTLTWNNSNQFAGGAHTDKGLTKLGRRCVRILETNGILVDTAHLSRRAFWEFSKITIFPIFNSHSNIFSLKRHKRNLTDKQIERIVISGGYVGLTLYDEFVGRTKGDSMKIVEQFDYLVQRFGDKCFGFGTDLYGIEEENLPIDIKKYHDFYLIEKTMINLGFNKKLINKIFFKNFEKLLKIGEKTNKN
ncbi:MAG: hypothetical protein E7351_01710 [Clostridiales bacterium]|nr:hypothetical protein [Clostridiales bacterium]